MKWGKKFGPQYVNRLYRMVQAHLTLPHRFICFTDDGEGLHEGVEVFPLPEVHFESGPERGWNKLGILSNNLGDISGQALFLDLDVLIINNMDAFFEPEGDFLIIKDWDFDNYVGNSSVFRFTIGVHDDVLRSFEKNAPSIRKQFRNEQAYLSHAMLEKGIIKYWDSSWCVSFKRHCLYPFPLNWFKAPKVPTDSKILIFHGHPQPEEAFKGYTTKFGFRHVKPTLWLADYWEV
ncbi:MAG: hypothetical protein R3Y56_05060 [Akkermansia sp.]